MKRQPWLKHSCALLVTALLVASAGYYKYQEAWAGSRKAQAEQTLKIAYLPITHALPLFEAQKLIEQKGLGDGAVKVELVKYGGWSELMDALDTGRVDGASVLIEMAMKAKEQGIDLSLSLLGHKDGNVVITSNEIQTGDQLRGRTFAIPSPQSSHNILLQMLLEQYGMSREDVTVIEMAPTEMPSALQSGQIDGYCVAEPFGAQAVEAGLGHVFATSKELWPDSICCGIVWNQDATAGKQEAVKAFEQIYKEAGSALTEEESQAVAAQYLGQDEEIVKLSLQWISFDDLDVTRDAYKSLTEKAEAFGLTQAPPSYDEFVEP